MFIQTTLRSLLINGNDVSNYQSLPHVLSSPVFFFRNSWQSILNYVPAVNKIVEHDITLPWIFVTDVQNVDFNMTLKLNGSVI